MKGTIDLEVEGKVLASFRFDNANGKTWALNKARQITKLDIPEGMDWQIILTLQSCL